MLPATPRVFVFTCVLLGASALAFGADAANPPDSDYALKVWETDDGLPHNSIASVVQRSDGFLWIGTQAGLVRFDGMQFTELASPLIEGVKSSSVVSVIEGDPQTLLIASIQSGLLQLRHGQLSEHPLNARLDPAQRILRLFHEADDVFWLVLANHEAWRWAHGAVEKFSPPPGLRTFWPASFARDRPGGVYLSRGLGLEHYAAGALVAVPGVPLNAVTIATARSGGIWLATGRRLMTLTDGRLALVANPAPWAGSLPPSVLCEDRSGQLWLGSKELGLLRWRRDGVTTTVATSHARISDLAEDDEGNLWVATAGGGLNRLQRKKLVLVAEQSNWTTDVAGSVTADAAGVVWFANRNGLRRIAPDSFESVDLRKNWPARATPICADAAGHVWCAVGAELYCASPATSAPPVALPTPSTAVIHVIFAARDGHLWVGRSNGPLQRFGADHTVESFGPAAGYNGKAVRSIAEDAAGHLWVGTEEGLLFEQANGRFAVCDAGAGVQGHAIRSIHADPAGNLWLGTAGAGVVVRHEGQFGRITQAQGLPDDVISQILADDFGWLWFGSRRGLCKVRLDDLLECVAGRRPAITPVTYGRADGLPGVSAIGSYQPTAVKTRGGRLWFVTRKGLVSADPTQREGDQRQARACLDAWLVDGRPVDPASARVPSSARQLEFQFTAPTFLASERVRFRYRLEGFYPDWTDGGTRRFATYPALRPGRYVFDVNASNGDLAWSPAVASLAFTVVPMWWETWWCRIGAGAGAVIVLVLLGRGWSHRRLRARLARLEQTQRVEHERRRIARDLHDDLGASLTQASMMAEELSEDWADLADPRAQSSQLATRVQTIARDLDAVVWSVSPQHDSLAALATYLCHFAGEYFRSTALACHAEAAADIPPVALSPEVRHHLFMIAKELLHNALKHAQARRIDVTMRMQAEVFELVVADDGRGFSVATAEGSGRNGLRNLHARAGEAGGTLDLVSTPQGTTATLRYPVNRRPPPIDPPESPS